MLDKNTHQKTIKSIYRYAYFKLQNKEEAEDIASESLSKLIEQLEKQEIENKEGYAFRIAQNLIYSKYKERKLTNPEVDPTDEGNIPKDYLPNPTEAKAIDSVLTDEVQAAIAELDDVTQDVILMRVWDDLPFQTIADSMQANLVTTKHRYYRGIEKVKQTLQSSSGSKNITAATIATALFVAGTKPAYAAPAAILSINSISMTTLQTFLATATGKVVAAGLVGVVAVGSVAGMAAYQQSASSNSTYTTTSSSHSTTTVSSTSTADTKIENEDTSNDDETSTALVAGENATLRKLEKCNVAMLQPTKSYPGTPVYRNYSGYEFYEIADFAGRSWEFSKGSEGYSVWGTDLSLIQQGIVRLQHSEEIAAKYPGTDTVGADYVQVYCGINSKNLTSKQLIDQIDSGRLSEINKYSPTYTYSMSEVVKKKERITKWGMSTVYYQEWENPNVSYPTKEYIFVKNGFIYIVNIGDDLTAATDANLDATTEAKQTTYDVLDTLLFGSLTKTYQEEIPSTGKDLSATTLSATIPLEATTTAAYRTNTAIFEVKIRTAAFTLVVSFEPDSIGNTGEEIQLTSVTHPQAGDLFLEQYSSDKSTFKYYGSTYGSMDSACTSDDPTDCWILYLTGFETDAAPFAECRRINNETELKSCNKLFNTVSLERSS